MTRLERTDLPADQLAGDVVVAFFFSDQRPLDGPAALLDWRLDGQLTRMLLTGQVKGKAGEHVLLQSNGKLKTDWVLFIGGGPWLGLCRETHASLVRHMLEIVNKAGFRKIAIGLSPHEEIGAADLQAQVESTLATLGRDILTCRLSCLPLAGGDGQAGNR